MTQEGRTYTFDMFTAQGRINVRRGDMYLYVGSRWQAFKLVLFDSGCKFLNKKKKNKKY